MAPKWVYMAVWLATILLVAAPSSASDVDESVLTFRGARIGLKSGEVIRAEMVGVVGDSLVLYERRTIPTETLIQPTYMAPISSFAMPEVARLEVGRNNAAVGAGTGAVAGLATLGILMLMATSGDIGEVPMDVGLGLGIMCAGIGAGIGAMAGTFTHHWETVYEPGAVELYRGPKYKPGIGYELQGPARRAPVSH